VEETAVVNVTAAVEAVDLPVAAIGLALEPGLADNVAADPVEAVLNVVGAVPVNAAAADVADQVAVAIETKVVVAKLVVAVHAVKNPFRPAQSLCVRIT
jgi:hypothetical protein